MCHYVTAQMKTPNKILTAQYNTGMLELRKYLTQLPCYKDEEGSPVGMERANRKFIEMDMGTVIISVPFYHFATAYWAAKGAHFPLYIETFLFDLTLMELTANATKAKINKITSKAAGLTPTTKLWDQRAKSHQPALATYHMLPNASWKEQQRVQVVPQVYVVELKKVHTHN